MPPANEGARIKKFLGILFSMALFADPAFAGGILPFAMWSNKSVGMTVKQLALGANFSCALLDNSTVKCWGYNGRGALGLGDIADRGDAMGEMGDSLPVVDLGTGRTAVQIVAGNSHTCALLDNSTVKCWGYNVYGQLGLGDTANRGDAAGEMGDSLPAVSLGTGRTAVQIVAGQSHTCAILDNSTVKCWGSNDYGQLGLGDMAARGDAVGEMGSNLPAVNLGTGRTAVQIVAGGVHTCAILDNSAVKCWGRNLYGQLGLGDTANRGDAAGEMGDSLSAVSLGTGRSAGQITAGDNYTCALLDNSAMKCWGDNFGGQLGLGDTNARGKAAGNDMGDSLPAVDLGTGRTAVQIVAGRGHTCAILDNSTVKCWGNNSIGQLGLGDTNNRGAAAGQMGDNLPAVKLGSSTSRLVKVKGTRSRKFRQIAAGYYHTCALLDNSTVKCWGYNAHGQLGLGDTAYRGDAAEEMGDSLPAVSLGTGRTAVQIAAGDYHTCAILDNSTVKCWGRNSYGQLGLGDTANRGDAAGEMGDSLPAVSLGTGRKALQISAGNMHTCALLDNSTVKCWGSNFYGELGLGNTAARGDAAGEMGDSLPAVSLGTGRTAVQISAGYSHSCALLDNSTVKCWGDNGKGQLGLGNTAARGDAAGEMGDSLPAVSLGTGRTAVQISAAKTYQTCALLDNSTVKCWGYNVNGQLGLGDTADRGDGAEEMGDVLPAVSLGTGRSAVQITAGQNFTCALLDNSTVKCWGRNSSGQLGLGNTADRGDAAGEMGDSLPAVDLGTGRTAVQVVAGALCTCAILDNSTMKCWGDNAGGQLGLGDTVSRGKAAGEMGDSLPIVNLGTNK